jgi:homoserine O-acetyltransferase
MLVLAVLPPRLVALAIVGLVSAPLVVAADYPAPAAGDWVAHDFRFHSGETLPEVRIHYRTIGAPTGVPILVLHGTTGSGAQMTTTGFAGQLFGPDQPLDASRYFIVLPDALGAGQSSKPSDGLRTRFPFYDVEDIVRAQYRLLTEHFGIRHLRTVVGYSAGGMQTWLWGELYPDFMDTLVPMASMPIEMSGRNWMLRRMLIDTIRNDPGWNGGNYDRQPYSLNPALANYGIATSGGTRALFKAAPTRAQADAIVARRLSDGRGSDANDVIYQYDAASDYNPAPALTRIRAAVLAINSADDERNPPELGVMERELKQIPRAEFFLIPASDETTGHGAAMNARLWAPVLQRFLQNLPSP